MEVGRPDSNETPLKNNAWLGNARMVDLLLANGADPNFPASHKETIVSCAARHDHNDNNGTIVAALIDAGGRWTVADLVCAGLEERLIAAIDRDPELVNRHGPLPGGITGPPLYAGLYTDFFHHEDDREVRMMAVLLKRGADIHAEDGEGCTVFGRTIGLMQSRHDAIVAKAKTVRSFLLDSRSGAARSRRGAAWWDGQVKCGPNKVEDSWTKPTLQISGGARNRHLED